MNAPACLLFTTVALGLSLPGRSEDIGTTDIISRTAEATLACMQWTPVGLCFWLKCTWFSCEVESSLKIGHYNPDLVVSSYNELGENPWQDVGSLLADAQRSAAEGLLGRLGKLPVDSSGNRSEGGREQRDHKNLIFREVDAIGHPALALPLQVNYACESSAQAFMPYFLSGLDALSWRHALPEILYPASLTLGLREVGDWPRHTWGSVYPRTGWSIQAEEPKAAALTAQRAGDIVTRERQPHVYRAIEDPDSNEQRIWPPPPLREADATTGSWQMLAPKVDSDCAVFGINDLDDDESWSAGRVDEAGDYTWSLWRPYQCCEREGQAFLFDINWIDFPR